ncbi:MAG: hypothetical protein MJE77_39755 [Proteobacteria bacterium]|nr:hypothetical protein [Pseudomonadota bacterium]
MKKQVARLRGVADIRTMSGRFGKSRMPHELLLRLASLELERARRNQERTSALERIRVIEERFAEIDAEKESICQLLQEAGISLSGAGEKTPTRAISEAFCIRY